MNILHIFGRLNRGGAEMRTLDLMRNMDQAKFKFNFCVLSGLPGELDEEVKRLGGEIFYLKLTPSFPIVFKRLLRQKKISIVHSHVHFFSGFMLWLAAQAEVPGRIAHFRNMADGKSLSFARRIRNHILKNLINRYATDIVAVCEGAMRFSWGEGWQNEPRCRVIYNGLDVSSFNGSVETDELKREFNLSQDSILFIHVGRMVPQKNHERVLFIFKEIVSRCPDATLLMVGRRESAIEPVLLKKVSKLNLSKKVYFTGERSDVQRLLKSSNVLIFPSLWEGLPGVVLESCAVGTPVVASDLPGVREIAPQFPDLVKILPLHASDQEWAILATELIKRITNADLKTNISNFEKSIFSMEICTQEFMRLWDK